MKIQVSTKIKTRLCDAKTRRIVRESPWRKNLVLDGGLLGLAKGGNNCNPSSITTWCHVGSGSDPTAIASGAVTFTQSGTTLTASAGFFTAAMVLGIFKWGTGAGGNEIYITAFGSSTSVTVGTSATVAVPDIGTVWQVQYTTLQTEVLRSNTYQTNSGDNSTSKNTTLGTITFQRTYTFPVQGSPYTVNEIGYGVGNNTQVAGRIVLPSSDVVPVTNFYVVVIAITFAFLPNAPVAVGDVGTNVDSSGTAMLEFFALSTINSSGVAVGDGVLDGLNDGAFIKYLTGSWTQNSEIAATGAGAPTPSTIDFNIVAAAWQAGTRGTMRWINSGTITTAGQTCTGVSMYSNNNSVLVFDIQLTTPFTLPTGSFSPTTTFSCTWDRTLTN